MCSLLGFSRFHFYPSLSLAVVCMYLFLKSGVYATFVSLCVRICQVVVCGMSFFVCLLIIFIISLWISFAKPIIFVF